jgi:hypothetical protein
MLLYFPQGRFYSQHTPEIAFEPGITRLMEKIEKPFSLCFVSTLIDYFEFQKPSVSIYYELRDAEIYKDIATLEQAYKDFYWKCVKSQEK